VTIVAATSIGIAVVADAARAVAEVTVINVVTKVKIAAHAPKASKVKATKAKAVVKVISLVVAVAAGAVVAVAITTSRAPKASRAAARFEPHRRLVLAPRAASGAFQRRPHPAGAFLFSEGGPQMDTDGHRCTGNADPTPTMPPTPRFEWLRRVLSVFICVHPWLRLFDLSFSLSAFPRFIVFF
jgi:hypothetical protein